MTPETTRRAFLHTAGLGAVAGAALAPSTLSAQQTSARQRIIAVSCSPRAGKTTASALEVCLAAAKEFAPDRLDTELIELAGKEIPGQLAVGLPLGPGQKDDFPEVAEKLGAPDVGAIIVGTPVYFGNMSYLCKAFLDRCGIFRKQGLALANKVGAVLAVGGVRNGGQELTIQSVQTALMCHEMIIVGDGRPTAHFGATLWNNGDDDISDDEFGLTTTRNLGRRVAEVVLQRTGAA